MRAGIRIRQSRTALALALGLLPMIGCGASRNAEYSYEPWNVQASGTAGEATDDAVTPASTATAPVPAGGAAGGVAGPAVADPDNDVRALRTQVRQLREREQVLLHALDSARNDEARQPPANAPGPETSPLAGAESGLGTPPPAPAAEDPQVLADRVASLHAELAEERRRRQATAMRCVVRTLSGYSPLRASHTGLGGSAGGVGVTADITTMLNSPGRTRPSSRRATSSMYSSDFQ